MHLCDYVARALQGHDLSGEWINSGSHTYFFWPHKDMEGHPGWEINSINVATSETTRTWKTIHTIHTPIHASKVTMKVWLWRPNDIRGPCGRKESWYLSYTRKNPEKTSPRKLVSTGDRIRTAAWQARMLPPAPQRWMFCNIKNWIRRNSIIFRHNTNFRKIKRIYHINVEIIISNW